jgi:Domain of unknown function (DUF3372)
VQSCVSFPLSGAAETPGVITMRLAAGSGPDTSPSTGTGGGSAGGDDPRWRSIVVIFNATPAVQTQRLSTMVGASVALHPVLRESADPAMARAAFNPATGTFTVPPRTVAVFVQP